jgi:hypothetical protein
MLVLAVVLFALGWGVSVGLYAYHRNLDDRFKTLERDLVESIEATARIADRRSDELNRDIVELRREQDQLTVAVNDLPVGRK